MWNMAKITPTTYRDYLIYNIVLELKKHEYFFHLSYKNKRKKTQIIKKYYSSVLLIGGDKENNIS